MKKYATFMGLGLELGGITFVCLWLGQKIEQFYPSKGLYLVIALLLGFIGWVVRIILSLKKMTAKDSKNSEKNLADTDLKM